MWRNFSRLILHAFSVSPLFFPFCIFISHIPSIKSSESMHKTTDFSVVWASSSPIEQTRIRQWICKMCIRERRFWVGIHEMKQSQRTPTYKASPLQFTWNSIRQENEIWHANFFYSTLRNITCCSFFYTLISKSR